MELDNLQRFAFFSDDISWICLVRNNVHYLLDKSSRIIKQAYMAYKLHLNIVAEDY